MRRRVKLFFCVDTHLYECISICVYIYVFYSLQAIKNLLQFSATEIFLRAFSDARRLHSLCSQN